MKWAILGALLVFLPFAAEAGERETKPIECSVIEARSFGFVKCNYRPNSRQWRIVYLPTAYAQVFKSGKYAEMLGSLCNVYGDSIHETIQRIFRSGSSREISCFDKNFLFHRQKLLVSATATSSFRDSGR